MEVNGVDIFLDDRPGDRKVVSVNGMKITEDYLKKVANIINNTKHKVNIRIIDEDNDNIIVIDKNLINEIYGEFIDGN